MSDSTFNWPAHFAPRASRMAASEIRELLKLLNQPGIISFAGGIPDPALFPTELIEASYHDILSDKKMAAEALQYSVSEGYLPLRQWIAEYMTKNGAPCAASNILITNGSQQALDFLGKLFLAPNDTALVTAPTYLGALQAFNAYEPRYDTLRPETGSNRTPLSYKSTAAKNDSAVKFAYLVPDFANPSGITLTREQRTQTLDLANALDIPVIEDAAYVTLRYDGEAVPSMLALDVARNGHINNTRTAYLGTFSKIFVPAMRVGWVCAAQPLIDKLVLVKQAADLHNATINQMITHRLATSVFDSHNAKIREVYGARRDAMLSALQRHMPPGVTWTKPEGGMFVWMTLPEHMDSRKLLEKTLTEIKVAFVPGQAFHADGSGTNTLRLNFSLANLDRIEEGIGRLGKMIATLAGE